MTDRYDCSDPGQREAGVLAAVEAVRHGGLIVLPTDTVYGIGADAFTPAAVADLLAAKGRGRDMPPPVLVGSVRAATALVEDFSDTVRSLVEEFWPGALTLVCRARNTLSWDLGDNLGTVAVRMPMHALALELLKETGPLAVSSANISGQPAATTADEAAEQLGDKVAVILDGGPATGGVASTILDMTGWLPLVLREGAIPVAKLSRVTRVAASVEPEPEPRLERIPTLASDPTAGPEVTAGPESETELAPMGKNEPKPRPESGTDAEPDHPAEAPPASSG